MSVKCLSLVLPLRYRLCILWRYYTIIYTRVGKARRAASQACSDVNKGLGPDASSPSGESDSLGFEVITVSPPPSPLALLLLSLFSLRHDAGQEEPGERRRGVPLRLQTPLRDGYPQQQVGAPVLLVQVK